MSCTKSILAGVIVFAGFRKGSSIMDFSAIYKKCINEHITVIQAIQESQELLSVLEKIAHDIIQLFQAGNRLLLAGNGGSSTDAQHIASEFIGRFYLERKALDAEALTIDTSSLTAIGNDYSFNCIFSRQIEAKGKKNDLFLGITTSGTSKNIIKAFEKARQMEMKTVCFTGESAPSAIEVICDHVIRIPSSCTPRIQECHILLGHMLCEYVEQKLFR